MFNSIKVEMRVIPDDSLPHRMRTAIYTIVPMAKGFTTRPDGIYNGISTVNGAPMRRNHPIAKLIDPSLLVVEEVNGEEYITNLSVGMQFTTLTITSQNADWDRYPVIEAIDCTRYRSLREQTESSITLADTNIYALTAMKNVNTQRLQPKQSNEILNAILKEWR